MLFALPTVALSGIAAVEYFITMLGGSTDWLRWPRGLTLPVSWLIWSATLLYHRFAPATAMVVLLGGFTLLVVVAQLKRGRAKP